MCEDEEVRREKVLEREERERERRQYKNAWRKKRNTGECGFRRQNLNKRERERGRAKRNRQ